MSVESARWIYELQKVNPAGTDAVSEGDNHLRLIKAVLKDSFPSTFDGPQIPDIDGNAGKILAINETGTGVEWVDKYVPPAYTELTWFKAVGTPTSVPIDTETELNISQLISDDGTYLIMYGINELGSYDGEFKENYMRLTINGVGSTYGKTAQFTAYYPTRADHNFLSASGIFELTSGDTIGMNCLQDNGPNKTITVGAEAYINILRIA